MIKGFTGLNCGTSINSVCNPNPCLNNGVCEISAANSYTCTCSSGFNGVNCQNVLCTLNCINGGTCTITNNIQSCQCKRNF